MKTKILKLAIIVGSSVGLAYLGNRLYKHRKEMLLMADNSACNASEVEVKKLSRVRVRTILAPLERL